MTTVFDGLDWRAELLELGFAYGSPWVGGLLKSSVDDFCVRELMGVVPSGEGEHIWLRLQKRRLNTEQVAKMLARFANVPYRDVGYSGLKDNFAITEQWFSIRQPSNKVALDWQHFDAPNVRVLEQVRHSKKLKRATHSANRFAIVVRDLAALKNACLGELSGEQIAHEINQRCQQIQQSGVPNYFGEQRFGRDANNMSKAVALFMHGQKINNRQLRSMVLSSARSWLFNAVLSERVKHHNWQSLMRNEPANLDNTNSVFISQGEPREQQRLEDFDIHPTGPLWGRGRDTLMSEATELAAFEQRCISAFSGFAEGLEQAGLDYQRRALRCRPKHFTWQCDGQSLALQFELGKGQYATSVLREIVA